MTKKVSKEKLKTALAMCGLRVVSHFESLVYDIPASDIPATYNHETGKVTYKPEHEEREEVQCLKRTLDSMVEDSEND